ncbi:hypothetical protein BH23VER1_BH23VER1_35000 [soil metagenome]
MKLAQVPPGFALRLFAAEPMVVNPIALNWDERGVLFSGIKFDDTHAGVSNLRFGFDNWIYATVGYSGVEAGVGGERHEFAMAVFRFRMDGTAPFFHFERLVELD